MNKKNKPEAICFGFITLLLLLTLTINVKIFTVKSEIFLLNRRTYFYIVTQINLFNIVLAKLGKKLLYILFEKNKHEKNTCIRC